MTYYQSGGGRKECLIRLQVRGIYISCTKITITSNLHLPRPVSRQSHTPPLSSCLFPLLNSHYYALYPHHIHDIVTEYTQHHIIFKWQIGKNVHYNTIFLDLQFGVAVKFTIISSSFIWLLTLDVNNANNLLFKQNYDYTMFYSFDFSWSL